VQPRPASVALQDGLGGIPPWRVHADPHPGTATRAHLLRTDGRTPGTCELIDGAIVEKPRNHARAYLVMELNYHLGLVTHATDCGYLAGPGNWVGLGPDLVRAPDLAYYPWAPGEPKRVPPDAIGDDPPALAVDFLVPDMTPAELARKRAEYFRGGVWVAWVIDHHRRAADVYTAAGVTMSVDESGALDGGDVLPGFRVALAELFARLAAVIHAD